MEDKGYFLSREQIIPVLKDYFKSHADPCDIDMAFLYGSWACGYPKAESDVDIAVLFMHEISEEGTFNTINKLTLELSDLLKKEVNTLYIDIELSRPMLHYNAIIQGIPVFIRDFSRYVDIRLKAIAQMEDFGIFGIKWQSQVVKKRLEDLSHA